jgi:hypothetical protein
MNCLAKKRFRSKCGWQVIAKVSSEELDKASEFF